MNDEQTPMPLNEVLRGIHHMVEAGQRRRISQAEMARRLGISPRTYLEYLRGTHAPLAMRAILDMLAMLNDDDLIGTVRDWATTRIKDNT
jgi:putative transcriptional regulator